jgi:molybdenum cofactor cytidylyltransferase
VIALADMPAIRPATIEAVAQSIAQGAPTAAPMVDGQRGHPVGFAAALLEPLLAIDGDHGARDLLRRHPPRRIATNDRGALLDIDRAD